MNQNLPQRRSIRLKGYDYSLEGRYFITICTQERKCLFGEVVDDNGNVIVGATRGSPASMKLSASGIIVNRVLESLSIHPL